MAEEEVGSLAVKVAMDSSSFQQGVQNLKRQLNLIDSEFKANIATLAEHGKGLDGLKAKSDALSQKINVQKQVFEAYQQQLEKSKATLESNSQKMMDLKAKVEDAKSAWEESKRAVGENAEETQRLENAYKDLNKEYSNQASLVRNNAKTIDGYTMQVNNAKTKLADMEGQLKSVNKEISGFAWNSIGEKFNSIGEKFNTVGEKMKSVGTTLTTHITAPLVGIAAAVTKVGMDFEAQMSRVKAISGATGDDFKKLNDQALQLGADTAFSAKQAAEGMEDLASAGFSTKEIMAAMPGMLDLAASSGADIATSAQIAAGALRGFGLEASQSGHVADVLAKAAADTNAQVEDMGDALKYAAPPAHALGLSIEEVSAAVGIMANQNIKGEQAGTTLRGALTRLASPSKEAASMMEQIGFKAFDAQGKLLPLSQVIGNLQNSTKNLTDEQKANAIATIFGQETMSGMLTLLQAGPGELDKLTKSFKNSDGAAKEMAKTAQDNVKGSIEQMKGSLETAGIKLEQILAPSIKSIADKITELANKFNELSPIQQKFALIIAGITAAVGPVLVVISTLILRIAGISDAFGKLSTFLAEKQIGAKIAEIFKMPTIPTNLFGSIVTGLETAGAKISTFIFGPWQALGNAFKALPGLIKNISFADIVTKIITPFKNIPTLLSGVFAKIPTLLNGVKTLFLNLGTTIIGLGPKILTGIRSAFSIQGIMTVAKTALGIFTGPWGALALAIATVVGAVIANWDSIKAWVQKHFAGTLPQNFTQFKQIFENIWNSIQQTFSNVWDSIKQVAIDVWNYIGPTITSGVTAVQSFWNEVWPQIQQVFVEIWNVMKVILAPAVAVLYTIISGALGLIKGAWGDAWNLIKDTLKIVWDGITGVIRIAWDVVSGIIKVGLDLLTGNWSKAWADLKSIFSNVWTDIKQLFSNMITDALSWGKDLVQGIIDGILGAIGGVEDAVKKVADKIRSFLHFTVPDVGPLSDADTYGADFMQLLADTMTQNSDKPAEAAKKVADLIATRIQDVKDKVASETKELNEQLSNLNYQEQVSLLGTKGTARYNMQQEFIEKKKAIKDEIDLRKDQADKEIEQIQKIGKMSKEQIQDELDAKKKAVSDIDKLNDVLEKAIERQLNAEKDAATESAKVKAKEQKLTKDQLNSLLSYVNDYYEKKLDKDAIAAQAEQLITSKNQQSIIELLNKYGNLYEDSGLTLGQRLTTGVKSFTDLIPNIVGNAMNSVQTEVQIAATNVQDTLSSIMQNIASVGTAGAQLAGIDSGSDLFSQWQSSGLGSTEEEDPTQAIEDKYKKLFDEIDLAMTNLGKDTYSTTEELKKQQDTIDEQNKKLDLMKQEYDEVVSAAGEISDSAVQLKKDIASLTVEIDNNTKKLQLDTITNKYKTIVDDIDKTISNLSKDTKDFYEELDQQEQIYVNNMLKLSELNSEYNELAEVLGKDSDAAKDLKNQIDDLQSEMDSNAEKLKEDTISNIDDFTSKVKDALKEMYTQQEQAAEDAVNAELENLDKWKEASEKTINDVYDAKIKALEAQTEAEDRAATDVTELANINNLQDSIDYEHNEYNKQQLQKQLNTAITSRNKRLHEQEIADQKAALEEEKQNQLNNLASIYNAKKQDLEKQLQDVKDFYAKRLDSAHLEAEAEKIIMNDNQAEIVKLLESYSSDYENAGRTLGQKLFDGFKEKIDGITAMISNITAQINAARDSAIQAASSAMVSVSVGKTATTYAGTPKYESSSPKVITNSFTYNSPTVLSPSEQNRQVNNMLTKAAFTV